MDSCIVSTSLADQVPRGIDRKTWGNVFNCILGLQMGHALVTAPLVCATCPLDASRVSTLAWLPRSLRLRPWVQLSKLEPDSGALDLLLARAARDQRDWELLKALLPCCCLGCAAAALPAVLPAALPAALLLPCLPLLSGAPHRP